MSRGLRIALVICSQLTIISIVFTILIPTLFWPKAKDNQERDYNKNLGTQGTHIYTPFNGSLIVKGTVVPGQMPLWRWDMPPHQDDWTNNALSICFPALGYPANQYVTFVLSKGREPPSRTFNEVSVANDVTLIQAQCINDYHVCGGSIYIGVMTTLVNQNPPEQQYTISISGVDVKDTGCTYRWSK